jgi:hypothetical protein
MLTHVSGARDRRRERYGQGIYINMIDFTDHLVICGIPHAYRWPIPEIVRNGPERRSGRLIVRECPSTPATWWACWPLRARKSRLDDHGTSRCCNNRFALNNPNNGVS